MAVPSYGPGARKKNTGRPQHSLPSIPANLRPIAEFSDEELAAAKNQNEAEAAYQQAFMRASIQFLEAPSHGTAADVLNIILATSVIFERTNLDGRGEFFQKAPGTCYYEPFPTIRESARAILEEAVEKALAILEDQTEGRGIKDLYAQAGKAKSKSRTRDFISGALTLFSDSILVFPNIRWNETPETIPTLTELIDFSGLHPIARQAREGEYFRNPAPCTAEQILKADQAAAFMFYMHTLFPDPETMKAGLSCVAACISGKPTKTFQVWTNDEGDGGKNTLFDFLAQLIPGRIIMAKNALILYKGDSGERRFGEIELQGRAAVFFDEVGGYFDIAQIKRYTGLSSIRGEMKGRDSTEFTQTWALIALCNELPKFFPSNDGGFLSRVFVLPFGTVFYADEADKKRRIDQGVSIDKLKPAADKTALLDELLAERPAIIKALILEWINAREERGGKPYAALECTKAKEAYRQANDIAERFFGEYLIRDDKKGIPYTDIKTAWTEFSGDSKPAMKDIVAMLTKRFPFIHAAKSNGTRKLAGIDFKADSTTNYSKSSNSNDELFDKQGQE